MAQIHNISHKYLWNNGIAKLMPWFEILLLFYALFFLFHGPITDMGNDYLTIAWGGATLYFVIVWLKRGSDIADTHYTYIIAYLAEQLVKRKLKKELPQNYHVIYDYKYKCRDENIDFIIVSPYGVYVIEVKYRVRRIVNINQGYTSKSIIQTENASKAVYNILNGNGERLDWVQSVLLFPRQKRYPRMKEKNIIVLGRDSISYYFVDLFKSKEIIFDEEKINHIVKILIS
jgi:hypothetical protein